MRIVKKMGFAVILLALGLILEGWLAGPADVARGQDLAQRFVVAVPPGPCELALHSELVVTEDGSANADLIALPPSPCGPLELEIITFPAETALCVEDGDGMEVRVACELSARYEATTFTFIANAEE